MSRKMFFSLLIALFIVFAVILAACEKIVTKEVEKVVTVEVEKVVTKEVEKVVTKEVEKVVIKEVEKVVTKEVEKVVTVEVTPVIPTSTVPPRLPVEKGSVAILVVDDFTIEIPPANGETPVLTVPKGITTTFDNCAFTLDGQQGFGSSGAQGFGSSGAGGISTTGVITQVLDENGQPIPHGQLVYNHIRNELNAYVVQQATPIPVSAFPTPVNINGYELFEPSEPLTITGNEAIYLVPVDTSHYTTPAVINQIEATIEYISMTYKIQYFVINMSFVIMPCDLGRDNKGGTIETKILVEDYLKALENNPEYEALREKLKEWANTDNFSDTVRNRLLFGPEFGPARLLYFHTPITRTAWLEAGSNYDRIKDDILRQWLVNPKNPSGRRVISVAAAGNAGIRGYEYPFAPAIWDNVVSVSAYGWDPYNQDILGRFVPGETYTTTKTLYSNPGEIALDGELNYPIPNPKNDLEYYFGTSFATPRLSVLEALHLLSGGDIRCFDSRHTLVLSYPPLGYADGLFDPNNLAAEWQNLLIATAVPIYCPDNYWKGPIPTP